MFSLKYRMAWNFRGYKGAYGEISSSSSSSFTLKHWDCFIEVNLQTLPNSKTSCKVYLRFPVNPLAFATIQNCSYYLLNEATGQHCKLVNLSPFSTEWFELGECVEFLVVLAVDLGDSTKNSKFWLEAKTEALNLFMYKEFSYSASALLNGKEYRLNVNDTTSKFKSILMEGLEEDECGNVLVKIRNNRSGRRCFQMDVRSHATEFSCKHHEEVTSIELKSISTTFKKMSNTRISKISQIIDSMTNENAKPFQDICEMQALRTKQNRIRNRNEVVQLPESSSVIPAPSTSCPKTIIDGNPCPQDSTSPAAVEIAVTADQLKLMYECFTDNKFCDITIQIPGGDEIKAHKQMLFSGSTVWRTLLNENDQLSILTVDDLERETIETLVVFIYIGSVLKPPKQTDQLLIAAERYGVEGLKIWCEQKLIDTISMDTAVNLLVLAHQYNAKTLFNNVLKFVRKHTAVLKERDEWKSAFFSYPELAFEIFNVLL